MIVRPHLSRKMDPLLSRALEEAVGDEVLSAVMLLGTEDSESPEPPPRSEFSSRQAWRQALIDSQRRELEHAIGDTIRQLEDLSLNPRGGKLSRAVVVEGPAHRILSALELAGVRHASLNRSVEPT